MILTPRTPSSRFLAVLRSIAIDAESIAFLI